MKWKLNTLHLDLLNADVYDNGVEFDNRIKWCWGHYKNISNGFLEIEWTIWINQRTAAVVGVKGPFYSMKGFAVRGHYCTRWYQQKSAATHNQMRRRRTSTTRLTDGRLDFPVLLVAEPQILGLSLWSWLFIIIKPYFPGWAASSFRI